jgi:DNA-binding NarL/FixJ family response regulator
VLDQLSALGISGLVQKPFTPAALVEKIRAVISLPPAPPAPPASA